MAKARCYEVNADNPAGMAITRWASNNKSDSSSERSFNETLNYSADSSLRGLLVAFVPTEERLLMESDSTDAEPEVHAATDFKQN